jgi:hypothetical protein
MTFVFQTVVPSSCRWNLPWDEAEKYLSQLNPAYDARHAFLLTCADLDE